MVTSVTLVVLGIVALSIIGFGGVLPNEASSRTRLGLFIFICLFMAVLGLAAQNADAHYTSGCKKTACKTHVIQPYKKNFLGPVGRCEAGPKFGATLSLKTGLKAIDPSGTYYGRYQFGLRDWGRAGGKGDPRDASWLEQAYRAVVWLNVNGRQSWPNC